MLKLSSGEDADFKFTRRKKSELTDIQSKVLPHDIPAEQGILGCILLGGLNTFSEISAQLHRGYECFYDPRHQEIYSAVQSLYSSHCQVDLITLQSILSKGGNLKTVGGISYLAGLPDCASSPSNWPHYVSIVSEKHLLRRMISTCQDAAGRAYACSGSVDELMSQLETDVLRISQERSVKIERTAQDVMSEKMAKLDEGWTVGQIGLKTGYPTLDGVLGLLRPGNVIVIGAAPGTGKSSLAANIACNHCSAGTSVGVVTLEMESLEWMEMITAIETGVSVPRLEQGGFSEVHFTEITGIMGKISKWPLYLCDNGELTIQQIRNQSRRWKSEHKIELLIIDYLQLIRGGGKFENATTEVTHVSKQIKAMAKELQIPIIVLASLNRESRKDNREPEMSDLRQSGSIESDADKIIMLHPDGEYLKCLIRKNRRGPTKGDSVIRLRFKKEITRFEDELKS